MEKQLQQVQSYLHRMAQQLQWAFDTLERAPMPTARTSAGPEPEKKREPQQLFAEIKNLIVKNADIVNAYSEQIRKKLEGEYVARSEFGTYREQTSQALEADSRGITQLFRHTAELSGALDAMEVETASTRAYLRTGCLSEGVQPVYGLEIGQRTQENGQETFRKFARFTADRLSFFDRSDVEVAYISDYKLFITNAQVTGSLELGSRFRISFQDGLAFQWTGGKI